MYQITTMVIGVCVALVILLLVRRNHLHGGYGVWWLLIAVATAFAGMFPRLLDKVGMYLGVTYPPILVMVLAVGLILVKMLTMDLDRSRQEKQIRRMAQRVALLEEELARAHTRLGSTAEPGAGERAQASKAP